MLTTKSLVGKGVYQSEVVRRCPNFGCGGLLHVALPLPRAEEQASNGNQDAEPMRM